MTFHVGQKVVCIDDTNFGADENPETARIVLPNRPVRGRVYTVRGIDSFGPDSALYLNEIRNPGGVRWADGCGEGAFHVRRFRPVVERKTDISIFTAMLTGTKTTEKAK